MAPGVNLADGVAALIDQTLLRPDATEAEIERLCTEALAAGFKTVCINPCYVRVCAAILRGTGVGVCSVVGFPLGSSSDSIKLAEAGQALNDGARELDIVMNVGFFKSGKHREVAAEIKTIGTIAHAAGALVKVIIEAPLLSDHQKAEASRLVAGAGADFVKTSTGTEGRRAIPGDVRLIRQTVSPSVGVKAAGGIRTFDDILIMIEAGANRIGTSTGIQILREAHERTIAQHS